MGLHLLRALPIVAGIALCAALGPASAHAQSAGSQEEARAHYERGIALYDEGQFVAALAEFEAAYAQSRRAPILYNVGQIHARLGRAVEAVDALERYLAEGEASISAERRTLVERELETQRARIATVTVTVATPGALVLLDDVDVGATPLAAPLRVSAGEHVIAARADGFETTRFRFRIAGGETRAVSLELVARGEGSARLRVSADVPGAEVLVDGRSVGLTPIEVPLGLPPGTHRIEVSRAGYEPLDRTVELPASGEASLSFDLVRSPRPAPGVLTHLALAVPSTSYVLRIDGETIPGQEVDVPHGLHDLTVEAADMQPVQQRVDIPAGPTFVLDPGYQWSAPGRHALRAGAESQRINGIAILVVGAAVAAAGGGFLIGREVYAGDRHLAERRDLSARCVGDGVTAPVWTADMCDAAVLAGDYPEAMFFGTGDQADFGAHTNQIIDLYEGLGIAGYVLLGAGLATAVGGVVLIATAPSDESIDASTTIQPRVSLDLGLGGLSLRGTF